MVHQSAIFYSDLYVETLRRSVYATPKNYLDFLLTFLQLYKSKTDESVKQAERLNVGIVRIDEASVLIKDMDRKLEKQRRELSKLPFRMLSYSYDRLLAIKTKKCDDLLEEITGLTAKQTERKTRVRRDSSILRLRCKLAVLHFQSVEKKRVVDEQLLTIEKEKHEAESQLQETMPALHEAEQGLDTLRAADITEMRSFANPVDTLRLIGYCMLIYLGHPSISWKDVGISFDRLPS